MSLVIIHCCDFIFLFMVFWNWRSRGVRGVYESNAEYLKWFTLNFCEGWIVVHCISVFVSYYLQTMNLPYQSNGKIRILRESLPFQLFQAQKDNIGTYSVLTGKNQSKLHCDKCSHVWNYNESAISSSLFNSIGNGSVIWVVICNNSSNW